MNTGEDVATAASELSSGGGLTDTAISLPSDLTVFVIASICVLCIAFISAFEGLKGERKRERLGLK